MKFLFGTCAYNSHVQNMALALHEAGALGAFYTAAVDNYRQAWLRGARRVIERTVSPVDQALRRRRMSGVPDHLISQDWTWELPRTLGSRLGLDARIVDWLWERMEHRLDRKCARGLARSEFDAFFGVEHGSLAAITLARRLGKRSVVAFLSPHHTVRERWVDREYERFPELMTSSSRRLLELARRRDARRDEEAGSADIVYANSRFTEGSLVAAGIRKEKIITVPCGSPPAISRELLPTRLREPMRFVYAGPVSVHKGAHYLLEAWRRLDACGAAELHLYGIQLLPERCFAGCGADVVLHGSVPQSVLFEGYREGAILVLPTLCDGYGLVVAEALSNGLPVITTRHAGAADLIEEGRNGFVVSPGDVEALVERMEWCVRHPDALVAMRRDALASAQRWTWVEFRALLRGLISQVLDVPLVPGTSSTATARHRSGALDGTGAGMGWGA